MSDKPCNKCGGAVHWPTPYVDGCKLLNADNSVHNCAGQQTQQAQTTIPQNNPPVITAKLTPTNIMGELAIIWGAYGDKENITDAKFESLCKVYISRMMSQR